MLATCCWEIFNLIPFVGKGTKKAEFMEAINVKLLTDEDYVLFIQSVIAKSILDSKCFRDSSTKWDFIKCMIRTETISYSII